MASSEAGPDLEGWLTETRAWSEVRLEEACCRLDLGPEAHEKALRYALFGPGKRLRPALVRLVCQEAGGSDEQAAAPAVAVELVHTYSLVHDDLPSMDDDDLRRGRPTCHVQFGEAEAVLVGDSLQALAFEYLARYGGARAADLVSVLAGDAGPGGMVGGQSLDLASHEGVGVEAVREIHTRKTAALIGAAAEMGAIAAGAEDAARSAWRRYGLALGACFQAIDDVLDVTGDAGTLGKTPGKDEAGEKATLVSALGLEGAALEARQHAEEAASLAMEAGAAEQGLAVGLVGYFLARTS